jgi:hypothetical protein
MKTEAETIYKSANAHTGENYSLIGLDVSFLYAHRYRRATCLF